MDGLTPWHMIIVAVVALVVLGPRRLPETGAAVGHALREFRRALTGEDDAPVTVTHDEGTRAEPTQARAEPAQAPDTPKTER